MADGHPGQLDVGSRPYGRREPGSTTRCVGRGGSVDVTPRPVFHVEHAAPSARRPLNDPAVPFHVEHPATSVDQRSCPSLILGRARAARSTWNAGSSPLAIWFRTAVLIDSRAVHVRPTPTRGIARRSDLGTSVVPRGTPPAPHPPGPVERARSTPSPASASGQRSYPGEGSTSARRPPTAPPEQRRADDGARSAAASPTSVTRGAALPPRSPPAATRTRPGPSAGDAVDPVGRGSVHPP